MNIASYAKPLNQSDGRKLFVQLSIYTNYIYQAHIYPKKLTDLHMQFVRDSVATQLQEHTWGNKQLEIHVLSIAVVSGFPKSNITYILLFKENI